MADDTRGTAPDPDATGTQLPEMPGSYGERGRETIERETAWARGRAAAAAGVEPRGRRLQPAYAAVGSVAFAALAENVRDYAIFLMDPDGIIIFWGEGARMMKWWTREEAEGGHLRMLYPDGGSEDGTAEAHLLESAATGEYTGEGQRVRSDGSTFWAGITLTALRDDAGELIGFAKVTRDITARRAADAAIKAASDAAEHARRQAEEASRAKSLFLATMSHEIRTPIQAIMGYTDLLGMELAGPLNEKQQGQLGRVRSSSMHLLGIVDEVLDFSRIEAGRSEPRRAALRVGAPVDHAVRMVAVQAHGKGVELLDRVSGHAADVPCWGDEDRVRQIVVVLLSNATKFTPPGGSIIVSAGTSVQPSPGAQVQGPGPWAWVRVEDTGPGIPADRLEAIFEPFEQADMSHTRQHGGAGLGLTIARRLARLMGGDLTVQSEQGTGARFCLWLPAASEEALTHTLARSDQMDTPGPLLLHEVRDVLETERRALLDAYTQRLRSDPLIPGGESLSPQELEDHTAAFLSDLSATLGTVDLAAGPSGDSLRDGTAIQRTVAERHGQQRRRLGWTDAAVHRDFQVLREELAAAIRRTVHRERPAEVDELIEVVDELVTAAERVSVESFLHRIGSRINRRSAVLILREKSSS